MAQKDFPRPIYCLMCYRLKLKQERLHLFTRLMCKLLGTSLKKRRNENLFDFLLSRFWFWRYQQKWGTWMWTLSYIKQVKFLNFLSCRNCCNILFVSWLQSVLSSRQCSLWDFLHWWRRFSAYHRLAVWSLGMAAEEVNKTSESMLATLPHIEQLKLEQEERRCGRPTWGCLEW